MHCSRMYFEKQNNGLPNCSFKVFLYAMHARSIFQSVYLARVKSPNGWNVESIRPVGEKTNPPPKKKKTTTSICTENVEFADPILSLRQCRQEDRALEQSPRLDSTSVAVGTERRARRLPSRRLRVCHRVHRRHKGKSCSAPLCQTASLNRNTD